jgi:GT2 family glycosyltransferase
MGCRVIAGGLPAVGRNAGARLALDEILLFVDADVTLTREIFEALKLEFSRPDVSLVYFRMESNSERPFVKAAYKAADLYAQVSGLLGACQGSAPLIGVTRAAYAKVGGFDEKMGAAEEVDFIRRVGRQAGGVKYVRYTPLYVSARRFDLEGGVGYAAKCILWGFLRLAGLRTSLVPYRWERYSGL